jgi:hypothetical protein
MNYDNWLARVSSLPHVMPGATFGKDVYAAAHSKQLDLYGKMMKCQEDLDAIKNTTTKTYANAEEKLNKTSDAFYLQRRLTEQLSLSIESAEISEGCKTYLMNIWIAHEFGRATKDIRSKYIEKGIQMEDTGLIAYGIVKGWVPEKCTERKDDGYIMGEIDYYRDDTIYDNKSSWDIWTFYQNVKYLDNPNSNPYFPNMQGYMKLWDKPKSKVVYTLLDTPAKLIENEKKRISYDFTGSEQMLQEALEEVEKNLLYSDIPIDRRIIEINIERDEDYISKIPLVIKACRTYLNNIRTIYYEKEIT